MKITLKLTKSVNENANIYFEKSKKLKAKIPGIEKIIIETKKEIKKLQLKKKEYIAKKEEKEIYNIIKNKHWYDKFRFTFTSEGFLVVIGKDAGTNEILIKKYLEENDLILHTQAPGSPFGLIKNSKNKIDKQNIEEALQFVCCFSKQWSKGFGTADGFYVFANQISKKAQSGEFISKGSFMVRGTKNIIKNIQTRICLGIKKEIITYKEEKIEIETPFSGSQNACEKYCKNRFIKIEPGDNTFKKLNKEISKKLKYSFEDLPKYIPNNSKILKK